MSDDCALVFSHCGRIDEAEVEAVDAVKHASLSQAPSAALL